MVNAVSNHDSDDPISARVTDASLFNRAVLDSKQNDTSASLDVLRILAAQLVVVGHAISFFGVASSFGPPSFPYVQNLGVIIFFVLSGFVIAHALVRGLQVPNYKLHHYLIDRTARIYSAYLPELFVIALIDWILQYYGYFQYLAHLGLKNFFGNIVMLQNYLGPFQGVPAYGSAGHLWSVAVEFHIYVFVGAFAFALVGRNWYLGCLLVLLSAPVPLAFFSAESHGLPGVGLFIIWLLGFSIYFICYNRIGLNLPRWILFSAALVVVIIWLIKTVPGAEYQQKNYALVAAAFLAFVLATQLTNRFSRTPRLGRLIRFCANYSFSLYLLHHSILYSISRIWPSSEWCGAIVGILASNAFAILFAYYTEFRHRALAEYLKRTLSVIQEIIKNFVMSPVKKDQC